MGDQCFHTFTDDEGHPHDCTLTIGHKEQHYCEHDNRLPVFVVPRAAPPADAYTNPCVKCAHPSYYHFADRNGCIQCGCELNFWPSRYEQDASPADGRTDLVSRLKVACGDLLATCEDMLDSGTATAFGNHQREVDNARALLNELRRGAPTADGPSAKEETAWAAGHQRGLEEAAKLVGDLIDNGTNRSPNYYEALHVAENEILRRARAAATDGEPCLTFHYPDDGPPTGKCELARDHSGPHRYGPIRRARAAGTGGKEGK